MRRFAWLVLALGLRLPEPCIAKDPIADSVVKIHATCRDPDFVRPWNKGNPRETSGSGVVVDGKRILTNAHVVLYSSQIFVQGSQSAERVPAKVKAIAPSLDLAVIETTDAAFFNQRPPVPVANELPLLKQAVSVYGYPIGGEQLSVTQGIVSRIEYSEVHAGVAALRIQIDAAVNPGNSGGPAVANGKILGLVFRKIERAENIGYLIAGEEISAFLKSVADGAYRGKAALQDLTQPAENKALRVRLGLGGETGVVVHQPFSAAPDYPLKRWDVITRIGDHPLDNLGNVRIRDDLKLSYLYLVPRLAKDGRIKVTIFRDRKTSDVSVPVRSDLNLAIPFLMGRYPRYFVLGPMVFMQATQENIFSLVASPAWCATLMLGKSPLLSREMDQQAFAGEEIVTLGYSLLPHATSKGYDSTPYGVVTHLNGTPVRNLAHLVELLRDAKGEFLAIDLAGRSPPLVFRREEVVKATDEVLSDEGIRRQCSEDIESIWRAPR